MQCRGMDLPCTPPRAAARTRKRGSQATPQTTSPALDSSPMILDEPEIVRSVDRPIELDVGKQDQDINLADL